MPSARGYNYNSGAVRVVSLRQQSCPFSRSRSRGRERSLAESDVKVGGRHLSRPLLRLNTRESAASLESVLA